LIAPRDRRFISGIVPEGEIGIGPSQFDGIRIEK
jgi:hypothetical protein